MLSVPFKKTDASIDLAGPLRRYLMKEFSKVCQGVFCSGLLTVTYTCWQTICAGLLAAWVRTAVAGNLTAVVNSCAQFDLVNRRTVYCCLCHRRCQETALSPPYTDGSNFALTCLDWPQMASF